MALYISHARTPARLTRQGAEEHFILTGSCALGSNHLTSRSELSRRNHYRRLYRLPAEGSSCRSRRSRRRSEISLPVVEVGPRGRDFHFERVQLAILRGRSKFEEILIADKFRNFSVGVGEFPSTLWEVSMSPGRPGDLTQQLVSRNESLFKMLPLGTLIG